MATTYRKTPEGQLEIDTRRRRLSPRLRNVLILVDGRRTDLDIGQLVPDAASGALPALLAEGLIEALTTVDLPPRAAAREPGAAPRPPSPERVFERRKRELVRGLTDEAGPMAENLALRIERAASAEELDPLVLVAADLVGTIRGRSAATEFRRRFGVGAQDSKLE